MPSPSTPGPRDVERAADVVGDRLRHLAPARLEPAEAELRKFLGELAVLARAAEGLGPEPLPSVSARALGDVVSVLARDIAEAWRSGEEAPPADEVAQAYALLVTMRRLLP